MIAAIIPAHNEERLIGRCLHSLQQAALHPALDGEPVCIIVALDRCQDATGAICADHGVETLDVDAGCVGVARAFGVERAVSQGARWISCTDADSEVPADWFVRQIECGADAFCGVVHVADWEDYSLEVQRRFVAGELVRDGHPHVHGANMGFSAQAYARAGGFAPLACGEDVAFIAALERAEGRIARLADPCVITSARRQARAAGGFSHFLKTLEEALPFDATPEAAW